MEKDQICMVNGCGGDDLKEDIFDADLFDATLDRWVAL